MAYTLIKGIFRPDLGTPDGDSVRFQADDLTLFRELDGRQPKIGIEDTVQLRYEGIDTVEKQAINVIADASLKANKELLAENSEELEGYILSKSTDQNGRPIAFVFSGETSEFDGEEIFLEESMLRESVNYKMVAQGWAYVMFYQTLYGELREVLKEAFLEARKNKLGLHTKDATQRGVKITNRNSLKTIAPIFPKLWRRLNEYLPLTGDLSEFIDFLDETDEKVWIVSGGGRFVTFDNCVEVKKDTVKLRYEPFDLVFVS